MGGEAGGIEPGLLQQARDDWVGCHQLPLERAGFADAAE
jgi:hypothetical protein